jgi:hypothetical protein
MAMKMKPSSIPQFFMLIHNLFPNWWETIFSIIFFIKELPNSESVGSMYPQRVGTNASFTKICCD